MLIEEEEVMSLGVGRHRGKTQAQPGESYYTNHCALARQTDPVAYIQKTHCRTMFILTRRLWKFHV